MSECPSTQVLEGFSAGKLSAEEQARAEAHLADCARCRDLLAAMGKESTSPAVGETAVPASANLHPARAILGPLLVGLVGSGLFSLAVAVKQIQQLLQNVAHTYDCFPSLPKPALAFHFEAPDPLLGILYVVGLGGFFGLGLFTALLARPRADRR